MEHVDRIILSASPEVLAKLGEIDKKTQLSLVTFYDVYLQLSEQDKRQILIASNHSKIE